MIGTARRGNTTSVAEFNAFSDPEALDALLASPIPIHRVGYDLTLHIGFPIIASSGWSKVAAASPRSLAVSCASTGCGGLPSLASTSRRSTTPVRVVAPHLAGHAEYRAEVELQALSPRA
jgi:hypothetical protein